MKCAYCSAELQPGAKFCSTCGSHVSNPRRIPGQTANLPAADPTTIDERLVTCLVVEAETAPKPIYRLEQKTKIGRADDNDIVLDDPRLSRYHATVTQEDAGYILTDLGSTNGTFLNEKRINQPRALREGDRVRVGQVSLVLRRLPAAVEAQAAASDSPPTVMAPVVAGSAAPPVSGEPGSRPQGKSTGWLVLGTVVALLLCVLVAGGLFFALGGPDRGLPAFRAQATSTPVMVLATDSPAPAATVLVVTNTPEPVVTVVVTNTPEPTPEATSTATPTTTPLPTATPPPTVTPTPGPTTVVISADGSGDYASLAEAVAAVPPGSTIQLAAGTHLVAEALEIGQSLTLAGAGMDTTEIVSTAGEYVIYFAGPERQLTLRDVTVRYAGTDWANVLVVNDAEIDIAHCRFTGGIWNDEEKRGGSGLLVWGDSTGHVRESRFEGNGLHGIEIKEQGQLTIEGNIASNNDETGISYWGNSGGIALQNRCTGNGLHGISVIDQAQPTLESNTCNDNGQVGIRFTDESGGVARNNICEGNRWGLSVAETADPTLEGNACRNNSEADVLDSR